MNYLAIYLKAQISKFNLKEQKEDILSQPCQAIQFGHS